MTGHLRFETNFKTLYPFWLDDSLKTLMIQEIIQLVGDNSEFEDIFWGVIPICMWIDSLRTWFRNNGEFEFYSAF